MKITSPFFLALLAIVIYSICMLVYGTLSIFKNAESDDISAFGSILGGVGTLLSCIIALIIFYGWKKQHNKSIVANEAKAVFNKIHNERNIIHFIKFKLESMNEVNDSEKQTFITDILFQIRKLEELHNSNNGSISEFTNLIEGSKLQLKISSYTTQLEKINEINLSNFWVDHNVYLSFYMYIRKSEKSNSLILQELKTYIFA